MELHYFSLHQKKIRLFLSSSSRWFENVEELCYILECFIMKCLTAYELMQMFVGYGWIGACLTSPNSLPFSSLQRLFALPCAVYCPICHYYLNHTRFSTRSISCYLPEVLVILWGDGGRGGKMSRPSRSKMDKLFSCIVSCNYLKLNNCRIFSFSKTVICWGFFVFVLLVFPFLWVFFGTSVLFLPSFCSTFFFFLDLLIYVHVYY